VLDDRLVGQWSDGSLYLGSMEEAAVVFRRDGSGWTYWHRDGGGFHVARFTWRTPADSQLRLRIDRKLSGTWTLRGGVTRHHVDSEHTDHTDLALTYVIQAGQDVLGSPATLLELDRPIFLGTVGDRFARTHGDALDEDPTVG
jgi:hypothetical protein